MPRIRKKTSKRASTNDRAKLKHKVREGKKKAKKAAKKNTQWKSRVKKDPGIPNSIPFKDQIIAEVEQSRRDEETERERKRQLQKGGPKVDPSTLSGVSTFEVARTLLKAPAPSMDVDSDEEIDSTDAPLLIDRSFPNLATVLDGVDVIIQLLDARDPLAHRVQPLESLVKEKKKQFIFLLHKIDLVPRESVEQWLTHLRQFNPVFPFRSSSRFIPPPDGAPAKGKEKESVSDALGASAILDYLALVSQNLTSDVSIPVKVAFVGHSNSGKSSVINSLIGASLLPIYKVSVKTDASGHTTFHPQSVPDKLTTKDGRPIHIVDTPGLRSLAPETADESQQVLFTTKDMLLRSRGKLERVTDPMPAAKLIVSRANTEDLMVHYNIPAFLPGDLNAFLTCLARSTGRLKKKGIPDLRDTASSLLRDWRVGKFPYITAPSASGKLSHNSSKVVFESDLAALYERTDSSVLEALPTLKEMHIGKGLIRLKPGEPDIRDVDLESAYEDTAKDKLAGHIEADEDENTEDEDSQSDGAGTSDEMDEDEDNIEVDGDEDEESPPPLPSSKRKLSTKDRPHPPPKKVAFAAPSNRKAVSSPKGNAKSNPPRLNAPKPDPPKPEAQQVKPSLKNASAPVKSSIKSHTALKATKKNKPNVSDAKPGADLREQPYDFSAHFKS